MLNQIHIRDLATIEELHLGLETGSTMITGETGAGKSIFIEAIELALGARASANLIRPGKERADISLCFDTSTIQGAIKWLADNDLQQESHECIIRRVISADGRSKSYINGLPATLQSVRELSELLFHLHAQYEQQMLLKAENQRDILDSYAEHGVLAGEVSSVAREWQMQDEQIKTLREKTRERAEKSDYLKFQLEEFAQLKLKEGEWETLEKEHHKLSHHEDLLRHLQAAQTLLSDADNKNALTMVNDLRKSLEAVQPMEAKANLWCETLQSVHIQLSDLEAEIAHYLENAELDPESLQQIEKRVGLIFDLARKHKVKPEDVYGEEKRLKSELEALETSDETLEKLCQTQAKTLQKYRELSANLSKNREKFAAKFSKEITSAIRHLSLPHGEFNVELEKISPDIISMHGQEKIIFQIKTNPDQALQPLAKVISGGELSRLSLAVHLAIAKQTTIPTLIFDEVDTGVGGATAEKIGKLLQQLGSAYQVFCITHQPQVAALGQHHLLVEKYFVDKTTHTRLRFLSKEEKTQEIARMLGGEKITKTTLDHAKEMLAFT